MTSGPVELLVSRDDLRSCQAGNGSKPSIAAGQALLRIEKFSLTSNNLTYALAGNTMGYWDLFPTTQGWGRLPVWGFADVERSECAELADGERIFGLFPPAGDAVLRPGRSVEWGLVDTEPHRAKLPAVYNAYFKTDEDPLYDAGREDQLALLRIPFMTAYLIEQHLAQATPAFEMAVISSASSKTALALAHLLKSRDDHTVVGLTSRSNLEFVERSGAYHEAFTYEDVGDLTGAGVAYVDFAGNGELRARVHGQLAAGLERSVSVGAAHWERVGRDRVRLPRADGGAATAGSFSFEPTALVGPRPELFFAGDHLAHEISARGTSRFWVELAHAWNEFVSWTDAWLTVKHVHGAAAVEAAYQTLVSGTANPSVGYVIAPWATATAADRARPQR